MSASDPVWLTCEAIEAGAHVIDPCAPKGQPMVSWWARNQARAVLLAAGPHIAADALRDAADEANNEWVGLKRGWGSNDADRQTLDFARSAIEWLRARADALTPTKETT